MDDRIVKRDFLTTALDCEDFRGLGRRKIWRLTNLFCSEMLATAVTVFIGCGTVCLQHLGYSASHSEVVAAFSFGILTSVMLFGHISGSHLNPALSIAAVIMGDMSLLMFAWYTVAQCTGAVFGYTLVMGINTPASLLPTTWRNMSEMKSANIARSICCTIPPPLVMSVGQVVYAEAIGTAILAWAACSAWDARNKDKHDSLPVKFGFVIVAIALPLGIYTGCSINPARSFGPALIKGYWTNHWIYWVGPMSGSIVASFIYRVLFRVEHMELAVQIRGEADMILCPTGKNNEQSNP